LSKSLTRTPVAVVVSGSKEILPNQGQTPAVVDQ